VVVGRCLTLLEGRESPTVLDVGTGTGAIALSIADERAGARVTAVDVSEEALDLARENVRRTGLAVTLRHADVDAAFPAGPWDLVVSNPPYVDPDDVETLMPEVRDWEPRSALVGPGATEAVARGAASTLRPGGAVVLEVGDGQAARAVSLLEDLGFTAVRATADLTGCDRVVEGRR
jgi:release factor glutamine methyltransferase